MDQAIRRFVAKLRITESGCFEWTASIDRYGYGRFKHDGKMRQSHRWIYQFRHGSIPPDLTIDHLCRNPKCANTRHMEVVTRGENMKRAAINRRKNKAVAR